MRIHIYIGHFGPSSLVLSLVETAPPSNMFYEEYNLNYFFEVQAELEYKENDLCTSLLRTRSWTCYGDLQYLARNEIPFAYRPKRSSSLPSVLPRQNLPSTSIFPPHVLSEDLWKRYARGARELHYESTACMDLRARHSGAIKLRSALTGQVHFVIKVDFRHTFKHIIATLHPCVGRAIAIIDPNGCEIAPDRHISTLRQQYNTNEFAYVKLQNEPLEEIDEVLQQYVCCYCARVRPV